MSKNDCITSGGGRDRSPALISRRSLLLAAAGLFGSLALGGCDSGGSGNASGDTVTVTDCVGRSVEVPANPARIAGLDSFTGELMVMIGAGPLLVGTPGGVVSDELLLEIYPELADVSAPMQNGSINMEELMAVQPDVVVVKRDTYETDGQAAQLDAAGVPYVVVGYVTMAEQIAMMRMVGQVCGGQCSQRAEDLAGLYEDVIAECAKRVEGIPKDQRTRVYHAINAVTMTDGAQSLGTDWVNAAGGIDVSGEHPEVATTTDYNTTLEQIFDWDPDVFICNSADSTDYLLSKDSCAGLRAVQNKRVYTIPVGATRWGQRGSAETYLAMLWLGSLLYPDEYKDFDLKAYVVGYYRDYLGLEIDDDTYELMLSGRGIRKASTYATSQK